MNVINLDINPEKFMPSEPESPVITNRLSNGHADEVQFVAGGWVRDLFEAMPKPPKSVEMDWVGVVPRLPKLLEHTPSPKKVLKTLEQYKRQETPEKDRECIARFAHSIYFTKLVKLGHIDPGNKETIVWAVDNDSAIDQAINIVEDQQKDYMND